MSESNQVYYLDSWKLDNPSTQEPSNNNLFNISFSLSRPGLVLDSNNYLFKTDCLTGVAASAWLFILALSPSMIS